VSDVALGSENTAMEVPPAPLTETPVLAAPEGWVIDDLARQRLARQLARAPGRIRGVVAETSVLPHGASYRVHAERLCMLPLSDAVEAHRHAARGAVLLRPSVAFEVNDDLVEVDGGNLLVDPGAHVHDPWRPVAALGDASPAGRPPFPRRPVVVFLACEPEVEALDWARSLVNNLVRRDVEGRLAMLEIAEGLHLTQPCLPSEASIRALRPDVVVALDEYALDKIPIWCDSDRSTVAIALSPDVAATEELVSWQLGRAQGRLRARIGRQIDAPGLVSLVNRLCAGPHPAPPTDPSTPGATEPARTRGKRFAVPTDGPVTRRSVQVVTGDDVDPTEHPLQGLVDHLVAGGHVADISTVGACKPDALRGTDLLMVGQEVDSTALSEVIEGRAAAARPTIAYIESSAIDRGTVSDQGLELATSAARLVTSVGGATTGSIAVSALLRRVGIRTHLLPVLLTRAQAGELRAARRGHSRFSDPVIGWHIGAAGGPVPDYAPAVAEAVLKVIDERPQARVEAVGDPSHLPASLLGHSRVDVLSSRPASQALSGWAVHLWSPSLFGGEIADDTRAFTEVSAVGVPTVLPEAVQSAVGGYPPPGLLVDPFRHAEDWIVPLRALLDSESTRSRLSRAAMRRFDTMNGAAASAVAVNRLIGWALYTGGSR
jgi:hypothetical protein